MTLIPGDLEGAMRKVVANKVIGAFVEWTGEQATESLA